MVDGLEKTLQGRAQVIRLNVSDDIGARMAGLHHVRVLPTFVVFDGQGNAIEHYGGRVKREQLLRDVNQLVVDQE